MYLKHVVYFSIRLDTEEIVEPTEKPKHNINVDPEN